MTMAHLTYLIYIVLWEGFILGGCAYVVFALGHSGWWFALATPLAGMAYSPRRWIALAGGDDA